MVTKAVGGILRAFIGTGLVVGIINMVNITVVFVVVACSSTKKFYYSGGGLYPIRT